MLVNQGLTVLRLTDATPYLSEVQQPALATAADVHTRTGLYRLTANRSGGQLGYEEVPDATGSSCIRCVCTMQPSSHVIITA